MAQLQDKDVGEVIATLHKSYRGLEDIYKVIAKSYPYDLQQYERELSIKDIQDILKEVKRKNLDSYTIYRHVKQLKKMNLITERKKGRELVYRLSSNS